MKDLTIWLDPGRFSPRTFVVKENEAGVNLSTQIRGEPGAGSTLSHDEVVELRDWLDEWLRGGP